MPIISGSGSGGAISGVTVTGTAASGQVPVASSATAGTWKYPPGFEIGYTQITAGVNVVSTTESSGTTIISPGALTFDGGLVLVEFFSPEFTMPTAAVDNILAVSLFEGATQITRLATAHTYATAAPRAHTPNGFYRFTPSAASHTYTVTAFVSSTTGTPAVLGGAGGTGALPPAFIRFTKV